MIVFCYQTRLTVLIDKSNSVTSPTISSHETAGSGGDSSGEDDSDDEDEQAQRNSEDHYEVNI